MLVKGGNIHTSINVNGISKSGKDKYQLEIVPTPVPGYNFLDDKNKMHIEGSKVILAIASHAMSKLFVDSPVLHQAKNAKQLWKDIHSIVNMRLLKINLYFEKPWWRNGDTGQPPINFGPSFTDLPINAVYPFYPIEGISNSNPAALTIYCDYNNTNFWQGLQNVGPLFGADSELQIEHSKVPQTLFAASQAVVDEALKQLKQLFNTHVVPTPVLTSYRNWDGEDNFGFAYHQWGQNTDDKEVISRMVKLVNGEDIFSCNEAWSDMQGWVNGAIRSTDLVLAEFNLKNITDEFTGCLKLDTDN